MTQPPDNIVRRGQPSRTAWRVATLRAVHQLLDEPIVLPDPVALPLLGRETEAALRDNPFELNDPMSRSLRASVVTRSRFAEEELDRAVAAGVRQYVLLGAGLDTFAHRNPHEAAGVKVFEVDHPATQQWKRSLLQDAGIAAPASVRYAAVDFEHATAAEGLAAAGFREDQPACFSWMGVTMYLTTAAVMDTLAWVGARPPGSSICFDYQVPLSQLAPVERALVEYAGQQIAALGEPWISAFDTDTLRQQLLAVGFKEAQGLTGEQMNARWLARRKDGLRSPHSYRLMCART